MSSKTPAVKSKKARKELSIEVKPVTQVVRSKGTTKALPPEVAAAQARKDELLSDLSAEVKSHGQWADYVRDTEYNNGIAYWLTFKNAAKVQADFARYNEGQAAFANGTGWPVGWTPYQLAGSSRQPELLNAYYVPLRNNKLEGADKWVPAPDASHGTVSVATYNNRYMTNKDRMDAYARSAAKATQDNEERNARKGQQEEEESTGTDGQETKVKKSTQGGKERKEWMGLGMCDVLRVLGSKGVSKPVAKAISVKMGFDPGNSTVHIQVKKGIDKDNVPELTSEQKKALAALSTAAAEQEDKPTKAKKTKVKVN